MSKPMLLFFMIGITIGSNRFAKGIYLDTQSNSLVHDSLQSVNRVFLDVRVFKLDRCVNEPKRGNVFNFMKLRHTSGEVRLYFYYEFKPEESSKDIFEDNSSIIVRSKASKASDTVNGYMIDTVFTIKHDQNDFNRIIFCSNEHNRAQTLDLYHFHLLFEIANLSSIRNYYDKKMILKWVNHFKYHKGVIFRFLDLNPCLIYAAKLMNTLRDIMKIEESERGPHMFDEVINNVSCFILNNLCSDEQDSDISLGTFEYVDKKKHDITYHLHLFLNDLYNFFINLCFAVKSLDKTRVFVYNKNSHSIALQDCWIFDIPEGIGVKDNLDNISVVLYGSEPNSYLPIPHFFDKSKSKIIIDEKPLNYHLLDFHSVVIFYNIKWTSKSHVIGTDNLYNSLIN